MKKIIISIVICICILIAIIILPLIINAYINDIKLAQLTKSLTTYPLPANTEIIEEQSICGKLYGNGNGMDFLATILIKSDLNLDELKNHYTTINKKELVVIKQESKDFNSACLANFSIKYKSLNKTIDYSKYYVVFLFDGGHWAFFDLRGN